MTKEGFIMSAEKFSNFKGIPSKEIPKIPLYMDQVTSWFDEVLSDWATTEEDKTLTKTMINNYVKSKLVSPPEKKKYNSEQLMQLLMIFHLKNILTMEDLKKLFQVQANGKTTVDLNHDYEQFYELECFLLDELKTDGVFSRLETATHDEKRVYALQLALEANIKKKIAEVLIQSL
jgi:hypothetical protein